MPFSASSLQGTVPPWVTGMVLWMNRVYINA